MKEDLTIDAKDITKLKQMIENNLPPKEIEKAMYGEVFTPLSLVQEMLDAIEKYADKNFWKNPKMKILDPAAGIGNFPLIAFEKLMTGLESAIPSKSARKKHILEKMLYMVELNPNNVRLMRKIFGGEKYKLNILTTSFLLEKQDEINKDTTLSKNQKKDGKQLLEWKAKMKFDLVMGNPPFNDSAGISGGGNNLYQPFVYKSLKFLSKNGYVLMISPTGIFKSTDYKTKTEIMAEILTRMSIMYINMNECEKYFPDISNPFTYFLVKNTKSSTIKCSLSKIRNVIIKDINIDISTLNWIPVIPSNVCISIIKKCSLHNFEFIRNDNMKQFNNVVFFKRQNHINYKNPTFIPMYDFSNKNNNKGVMIYHNVKSLRQARLFCQLLDSNVFRFLNIVTRYDAVIYHNLLNQFGVNNDIMLYNTLTNHDIYDLYKLSKEEISLIETVLQQTECIIQPSIKYSSAPPIIKKLKELPKSV